MDIEEDVGLAAIVVIDAALGGAEPVGDVVDVARPSGRERRDRLGREHRLAVPFVQPPPVAAEPVEAAAERFRPLPDGGVDEARDEIDESRDDDRGHRREQAAGRRELQPLRRPLQEVGAEQIADGLRDQREEAEAEADQGEAAKQRRGRLMRHQVGDDGAALHARPALRRAMAVVRYAHQVELQEKLPGRLALRLRPEHGEAGGGHLVGPRLGRCRRGTGERGEMGALHPGGQAQRDEAHDEGDDDGEQQRVGDPRGGDGGRKRRSRRDQPRPGPEQVVGAEAQIEPGGRDGGEQGRRHPEAARHDGELIWPTPWAAGDPLGRRSCPAGRSASCSARSRNPSGVTARPPTSPKKKSK